MSRSTDRTQRATETRFQIGMVFQKPNPFPAMSIYDNVLSGLRFSRIRVRNADGLVEEMLTKAGLWNEVRNRLKSLGRRALRGPAAAALHRARPCGAAVGPAHGRALLGARPDLDQAHRRDDPRDRRRGDRRHRHSQHATGTRVYRRTVRSSWRGRTSPDVSSNPDRPSRSSPILPTRGRLTT